MAESTLASRYVDIVADVGDFLGYGRGPEFGDPEYSTRQARDIAVAIRDGLSQFYTTPAVGDVPAGYNWSFLHPTYSTVFSQDAQTVAMPDDYGGIEGRITVSDSDNASFPWALDVVGEQMVREQYAMYPTRTGRPMLAAEVPLKGTSLERGQRKELRVFPAADQDYTLTFTYYLLPGTLTAIRPYPYGGAQHSDTITEACLAAAELKKDNLQGVHAAKFMERLKASIAADRKNKPQKIGVNRDRSDDRDSVIFRGRAGWPQVTINGTVWP